MPKICRCFSFDDIYQCKPTFFSKKCNKGNPLTDFEKNFGWAVLSFHLNISPIFCSWDLIITIQSKVFRGFFKFLQKITPENSLQNKSCSKSNIKGWQKKWHTFGAWGYGSSYPISRMDGDSLTIGYWEPQSRSEVNTKINILTLLYTIQYIWYIPYRGRSASHSITKS